MTDPTPKPLSPAAQAVMNAANGFSRLSPAPAICRWSRPTQIAAAVLRTVVDQGDGYMHDPQSEMMTEVVRITDLQAWAAELEGANG